MTDKNQFSKCPCCGSMLRVDWGASDFPGVKNEIGTCTFCAIDVRDMEQAQRNLKIAIDTLEWVANNHLAENEIRVRQLRAQARDALTKIRNGKE